MDVKLDVSGDMVTPQQNSKFTSHFTNWSNLSTKFPGPWEFIQQAWKQMRPWSEFLNTQNYKTVPNLQRLSGRILRNLSYFQSNYFCVFWIFMIYCLITSPLILIVLCGVFYVCHKIKQTQTSVQVFGRQINPNQQCLAIYIAAMPVLYLVGAGNIIFWVLGASCFVIILHASLYNIDAIVTEDTEGFLSEVV